MTTTTEQTLVIPNTIDMDAKDFMNRFHQILVAAEKSIIGMPSLVWTMAMALLTRENALITGEPGTAKSYASEVFAKLFFGNVQDYYGRAQGNIGMTSTVLLGGLVYNPASGELEPREGILLRYIVVQLDELNRMPPKTQAALLEALMEGSVEIDGIAYPVKPGFTAFGTANKADQGTYELLKPLADRFAFSALSRFPDPTNRRLIRRGQYVQLQNVAPLFTSVDDYLKMTDLVTRCSAEPTDAADEYITRVVDTFRNPDSWFVVPRGNDGEYEPTVGVRTEKALLKGATVRALSDGRVAATPADVQYVLPAALAHKLTFKPEARNGGSVRTHIAETLRANGLWVHEKGK